ncbi:extracellular solute-binding protein [Parasalinivibrio latis]|uniref:extracellular solute-binding protein n=1 Tax=Parasalinivibrio latis TaxID=2952610 RepID=UPI0030E15C21
MDREPPIRLKGLAWDHKRCWGPLESSIPVFRELHPNVDIEWDRQHLSSFGEGDLQSVLERYDLLIIDHPFIGEAAKHTYFHDLNKLLPASLIDAHQTHSVGASYRSYLYDDALYALPIDAASQVAAFRQDVFDAESFSVPTRLDELLILGGKAKRKGLYLGFPAIPLDIMCSFLSVTAAMGSPLKTGEDFIPYPAYTRAVSVLQTLLEYAHPDSHDWNPIRCYEHMVAHDDVPYNPLGFGYLNYSSRHLTAPLQFGDIVAFNNRLPAQGGLLGGAGIAISRHSKNSDAAANYLSFLCQPDFQSKEYIFSGGQPGYGGAWQNPDADLQYSNFFAETLPATTHAYLRPRFPGFMDFFRFATTDIAKAVRKEKDEKAVWKKLSDAYRDCQSADAPSANG